MLQMEQVDMEHVAASGRKADRQWRGMEQTREKKRIVYHAVKRLFDFFSSLCLSIVVSPLIALIALAIRIDSPGPVFYRHKRVGYKGKTIYLWKFRSMVQNADEKIKQFTPEQQREWKENYKLQNDPRITRVGKLLRKTSLDELPQLLNIIAGDMSVVGPRPVVQDELEKYGPYQAKFLSVKPGLAGYWQANGRSAVTYEERMNMELYYVKHAGLLFDLKILFQTIAGVLSMRGAV